MKTSALASRAILVLSAASLVVLGGACTCNTAAKNPGPHQPAAAEGKEMPQPVGNPGPHQQQAMSNPGPHQN